MSDRSRRAGIFLLAMSLLFFSLNITFTISAQQRQEVLFIANHQCQSFISSHDFLSGIILQREVSIDDPLVESNISYRLYRGSSHGKMAIREGELDVGGLKESVFEINFLPISNSGGADFLLCMDADQEMVLNLEGTAFDSYGGGERYIAGFPTGTDISFSTRYTMPIWSVLGEGGGVLFRNLPSVLVILFILAGPAFLSATVLFNASNLALMSCLSFGISAAPVIVTLIGYFLYSSNGMISIWMVLGSIIGTYLLGGYVYVKGRRAITTIRFSHVVLIIACISALILLRLVYLSKSGLPNYSDSPVHYQIIRDLLSPEKLPSVYYRFGELNSRYYHFGFHLFTAWASVLHPGNVLAMMPISGQMFLVVAALGAYFPLSVLTGNRTISIWITLMGTLFFYMPAHAAVWGKYPAIMATAAAPSVIGIFLLCISNIGKMKKYTVVMMSFLFLGSILIHSRMVFVISALIATYLLTKFRKFTPRRIAFVSLLLGSFIVVLSSSWGQGNLAGEGLQTISLVIHRYITANPYAAWIIILISLTQTLLIRNTKHQIIVLFCLALMLLSVGPIQFIPTGYLVDRPFLEILIWLPSSFILGTGLASGYHWLESRNISKKHFQLIRIVSLGILMSLSWRGIQAQPILGAKNPTITHDDLEVLTWISENLPDYSSFAVATYSDDDEYRMPLDAGGWIQTTMRMRWFRLGPNANILNRNMHTYLCGKGVDYVYFGSTEYSLLRSSIEDYEKWYSPLAVHPQSALYAVCGCSSFEIEVLEGLTSRQASSMYP